MPLATFLVSMAFSFYVTYRQSVGRLLKFHLICFVYFVSWAIRTPLTKYRLVGILGGAIHAARFRQINKRRSVLTFLTHGYQAFHHRA